MHFLKKENLYGKGNNLKLFLVHTGFYDKLHGDGFYEQHSNILIVAKILLKHEIM